MSKLIARLLTAFASMTSFLGASLIGYDSSQGLSGWRILLIVLAVLLGLVSLFLEVRYYLKQQATLFEQGAPIQTYMRQLIESGNRVAIFSRDLSWVDDDMKSMLALKSKRNEVKLVVPHDSATVSYLEKRGAEVVRYPSLGYNLTTRFTITNEGTANPRVAVGRPEKNRVRVEEFDNSHTVASMARDMMELLSRLSAAERTKES